MDATCSQNQTASSTQLSLFSTSFAHPLSFTYSSPGKPPPWKRNHHSGPSVAPLDGPIVEVRYRAIIPNARSLQTLPSPARAAVAACELALVRRQRGVVRHRNDATVDTRARVFTQWLAHLSFDDESLRTLTWPTKVSKARAGSIWAPTPLLPSSRCQGLAGGAPLISR
jgi:hypothetical protein